MNVTPPLTTPLTPSATPTAAPVTPTPPAGSLQATHPLIWAALLVWLSVEAIGDGLLAVKTLVVSPSRSRSVTPS